MMRLFHWRENAKSAAEDFRTRYQDREPSYKFFDGTTVEQRQALLDRVDPQTASPEDYGIMKPWVIETCDECDQSREVLVHFGDEPDCDVRWQRLCLNCLKEAVDMLSRATEQ